MTYYVCFQVDAGVFFNQFVSYLIYINEVLSWIGFLNPLRRCLIFYMVHMTLKGNTNLPSDENIDGDSNLDGDNNHASVGGSH
jgi:hypothetical protein